MLVQVLPLRGLRAIMSLKKSFELSVAMEDFQGLSSTPPSLEQEGCIKGDIIYDFLFVSQPVWQLDKSNTVWY